MIGEVGLMDGRTHKRRKPTAEIAALHAAAIADRLHREGYLGLFEGSGGKTVGGM
jgi:hypothetical protein